MRNDRIIDKLKAVTVANGCTEAEADTALNLLTKLMEKLAECGSGIVPLILAADPLLNVEQVSDLLGLSIPTIFKNVATGWLPRPTYPAPKAPRWRLSWIIEALEAKRALPREAMADRRKAKLERLRAKEGAARPAA